MFSGEERCVYSKNPLGEVICQLRFPEILTIEAKAPAQFQELIRDEYPRYQLRKESAPKLQGTPGNLTVENQQPTNNYQFFSEDGLWRISLTSKSFSLVCARYTCWEEFAAKLDKPLVAFIRTYQPAYFERVGLRYLNFISRKALSLDSIPFSRLISACYLGPLGEEDVEEASSVRCTVDADIALRGGCRVKLHAGPGMIRRGPKPDPEAKFILDFDLYMPGKVPVNLSAGALQTLHSQAFPLFRGAVSELLHDAMEPKSL